MYDREKFDLQTCFHCGNRGLMPIVYSHSANLGVYERDDDDTPEFIEHYTWRLLFCPVCNKPSLLETYHDDVIIMEEEAEKNLLYPQTSSQVSKVPVRILKTFENALKVKRIDIEQCLVTLRRVLEMICKDQGAMAYKLDAMIKEMVQKGVLPEVYHDVCWVIKEMGNNAVHTKSITFSNYQVEQAIELVQNILYFLYVMPEKTDKLKKYINDMKDSDEETMRF